METSITNHGDTMAIIMEMPTMVTGDMDTTVTGATTGIMMATLETGAISETMETITDTEIISVFTVATVNGDTMETTEIGIMILDTMDMTMVILELTTEIATTVGATMMSTTETGAGAIMATTEFTMTMTSDLDTTPSTSISD